MERWDAHAPAGEALRRPRSGSRRGRLSAADAEDEHRPAGDKYPGRVLATVRPDRPALQPAELPTSLGPLPDLQNMTVDRRRTIVFSENTKTNQFFINGKQFNHRRIDQRVKLNAVEEWTIRNVSHERHPFHIHVNDFQVMSVNGRPTTRAAWPTLPAARGR